MNSDAPGSRPRRGLWATLLVVALLWFGLVGRIPVDAVADMRVRCDRP